MHIPQMWCFNPFGRDDHCFFGWTASNDRRENVWMLVSSLCIPSFYKCNLACRSTGNVNWWKRTCLSYHSHSISCFCWITHHHGDSVRLLYPIIKSERVHLHFHVSCCLGIWNPVRWMSYWYATSTRMDDECGSAGSHHDIGRSLIVITTSIYCC